MDAIELLSRYADGERDFKGANLRGIILSSNSYRPNAVPTLGLTNIREPQNRPHLIGADLSNADLSEAGTKASSCPSVQRRTRTTHTIAPTPPLRSVQHH